MDYDVFLFDESYLRCGFPDIAQFRLTQTYIERFVNSTGRFVQDIKWDLVIARSSKRPSCEAFVRIRRAIPALGIFGVAISCSSCNAIASLMTLIYAGYRLRMREDFPLNISANRTLSPIILGRAGEVQSECQGKYDPPV